MKLNLGLLAVLGAIAACTQTEPLVTYNTDGNYVEGFEPEVAANYGGGAWAGPPPGRTEAERAARKRYYKGPRANEWGD